MGVQVSKYKFEKILTIKKLICPLLIIVYLSLNITNEELSYMYKSIIVNPFMVLFWYSVAVKVKENNFIGFMGEISFYIFLLHEPIINTKISELLLEKDLYVCIGVQVLVFIIVLLLCLIFIGLIKKYRVVERMFF